MSRTSIDQFRVADVADVISGFAFKSEWFGTEGTKVIRIGDLQNGSVSLYNCVAIDATVHEIPDQFRTTEGDILMALSGATTGKTAVVTREAENSFVNQRVALIRAKNKDTQRLLRFVFEGSTLQKLLNRAGGVAQPNLSPNEIKSLEIPLPPLSEQKRIADILDKADAIRRKRQEAISALGTLPGSLFHSMFGSPTHNAKGWTIGTIRDLIEEAKYGSSSKAGSEGQYPILRMNNITYEGTWDFTDLKYINLSENERTKYLVQKGDILFNRTNSKELVGKTAVYQEESQMAFAGYLVRARTNKQAHPEYIAGYLNSPHGKATLRHMCKNIVGMANINAQDFQNITIPHPPIEVQAEYVEALEVVRRSELPLRRALRESEQLFDSLVRRAFRGDF